MAQITITVADESDGGLSFNVKSDVEFDVAMGTNNLTTAQVVSLAMLELVNEKLKKQSPNFKVIDRLLHDLLSERTPGN